MTGLNVTATGILSAYELKKRRGESTQTVAYGSLVPDDDFDDRRF